MPDSHRDRLMERARQAFLDYGYDQLTMTGLAKACDLTRRALYHHFRGKEEAFREVIRWRHEQEIRDDEEAGEQIVAQGGSALDAIVAIFDARYGRARRDLERSPHAVQINYEAFRRCRDIMSVSATIFQERLAGFLVGLERRALLTINPGRTPDEVAQLLADGARGVNQSLPNKPASALPARYRSICGAILFGCARAGEAAARQ